MRDTPAVIISEHTLDRILNKISTEFVVNNRLPEPDSVKGSYWEEPELPIRPISVCIMEEAHTYPDDPIKYTRYRKAQVNIFGNLISVWERI